jgi:hypothetical protein
MHKKWRWLLCALLLGTVCAETDPDSLSTLKEHPYDTPKQVTLKEPISFKIVLEGKEAGSITVPANTVVGLEGINGDKILIRSTTGTTEVTPAQTDLWERVQALRSERDNAAKKDPAYAMTLPANSESAEWYGKQIKEFIDPWLKKYAESSLYGEMKLRKESFQAEAARVANGETRIGNQWLTSDELSATRRKEESTALIEKINSASQANDITLLLTLLPQVDKFDKSESHPLLLRASATVLDAQLARIGSGPAGNATENTRGTLTLLRSRLTPERAAEEEKILASLTQSASLDISQLEPVFNESQKIWPGNNAANRFFAVRAPLIPAHINALIQQGKIHEAAQFATFGQRLLAAISLPNEQKAALNAQTTESFQPLIEIRKLENALAAKDFETVLGANIKTSSVPIQKWITDLQTQVAQQKAESTRKLDEAQTLFLHLKWQEASAALDAAQNIWPGNPDIPARLKILTYVKIGAAIIGVFIILGILGWVSARWSDWTFQRRMAAKKREAMMAGLDIPVPKPLPPPPVSTPAPPSENPEE